MKQEFIDMLVDWVDSFTQKVIKVFYDLNIHNIINTFEARVYRHVGRLGRLVYSLFETMVCRSWVDSFTQILKQWFVDFELIRLLGNNTYLTND